MMEGLEDANSGNGIGMDWTKLDWTGLDRTGSDGWNRMGWNEDREDERLPT